MASHIDGAANLVAYELRQFAKTVAEEYREDFFCGINQDEWVRSFCEWFAEKQAARARIRASND